ncbi:outer envelope protein 61-like [Gossypium australe]|uniref:Outer envelope protein 61-like n=1 Tax=Gossypium australe TaxID=47621 RepID=A0A5B6VRL7_9ROSI|nr:outer envelope protein 61-like [Gossypium australe]
MFNGMMDPELLRIAQEQMSRMSPAELSRIQQQYATLMVAFVVDSMALQMMSNPDLMRMASESMKNMRPEDLRQAAEQLKHTRPEDMAEIGEKMANASPEEIAALRARADAQISYELSAAEMLKNQGNEFHKQGKFNNASEKYLLAKKNLKGIPSAKGKTLLLACSLNLMSCYLKTRQYDECVKEGSEVLSYDAKNVKALYRRGQAYKELGQFDVSSVCITDAVSDLRNAHEVSPDDETIADVLRDAEERLAREGSHQAPRGVVIEEITEETVSTSPATLQSSSTEHSSKQPRESTGISKSENGKKVADLRTNSEGLQALKEDPEALRSFQNFISSADPDTLAAMSGGKVGEVSPDMFKTASNMISKMSPEELQKMVQLASSFPGENPYTGGFGTGPVPPNVTPDMLKTATDMMTKMPTEELQKMFEMAASIKGKDSIPASTAVNSSRLDSDAEVTYPTSQTSSITSENVGFGETTSSSSSRFPNSMNAQSSFPPTSTADLQEQMRNQMKDPAMRQMFASMMKNMSPEMMANMSEQFGMKLSREDAAKAQQAMSSLSPDDLDRMAQVIEHLSSYFNWKFNGSDMFRSLNCCRSFAEILSQGSHPTLRNLIFLEVPPRPLEFGMRWVDRIQRGAEGAKKAKNWLLGKPGMILAICMLILAVILHRLGFIGS